MNKAFTKAMLSLVMARWRAVIPLLF
jgi:hypothetical protein